MKKFLGVAIFLFNSFLTIPVAAQGPFITISLEKSSSWYNCAGSPTANYINYAVVKASDGTPTSSNIPGKFVPLPVLPPKNYPDSGFNTIVAADTEIDKYLNGVGSFEYRPSLSCYYSTFISDFATCRKGNDISPAANICLAVTNVNDKPIKVQVYVTFSKLPTNGTSSTGFTTNTTTTGSNSNNNSGGSGTTGVTGGGTSSSSSGDPGKGSVQVNVTGSGPTIRLSLSEFLTKVLFTFALSWVFCYKNL
ncbi:hypothetical protein G9A89_003500 [Geosiphon pyriformis]|nr:hypothetical protein G9A89_003500 [Geosiphon pyriformis]